jgi:hypothetical protein
MSMGPSGSVQPHGLSVFTYEAASLLLLLLPLLKVACRSKHSADGLGN